MFRSAASPLPSPPGGRATGLVMELNFHNHCLLCLQHVDPAVLQALAQENPKGLTEFQPILHLLTGTVNNSSSDKSRHKFFPVVNNLPPLCTLCYDILAELFIFYNELVELQRKIQNQTEAARRIVAGTGTRGGMKEEFFNRLNIAGLPQKEVVAMEYFMKNFHSLINEADRKEVLPRITPMTLTDPASSTHSVLKPYSVTFADPVLPKEVTPPPLPVTKKRTLIFVNGKAYMLQAVPPLSGKTVPIAIVSSPQKITSLVPQEPPEVMEDQLEEPSEGFQDGVYYVRENSHDVRDLEYEGDEEEEEINHVEGTGEEENDDIQVLENEEATGREEDIMLEHKTELYVDPGEGSSGPMEGESTDLNYWKNVLSSQVIMEDVEGGEVNGEEVDDDEVTVMENPPKQVEFVDLEEEEEDEEDILERDPLVLGDDGDFELETSEGVPIILDDLGRTSSSNGEGSPASNRPRFSCSMCEKSYFSAQRLRYHEKDHLPGGRPKPFLCEFCQKPFSGKKLLEQHKRIHTGERPFPCDICGSSFRQASTLYRHKRAHEKAESGETARSRLQLRPRIVKSPKKK